MGKLVPKKPQHFNTIPSFETDVHKLIDTFVLKVKRIDETKFSIFKEVWRECSFSFIHQAVPLNVPAGDFLQLLYAVALNRLADPSPYLDYQADPGELTGTACGNAAPAEAEDAWGQRAGGVEVDAHLGTETRSGAGVEQRSPHQRAATGAAAVPIDARRSNSHIGKSSGAAGLAAAEEDPLDQECDLLAHIDELFGDLFQEQQVHHQNTLDQPFSMASHAPPLQNSGFGAAGNTANGGFLNVAPGAPPLPLHMLAGPQQHTTAARLSAGPYDALYEFQERVTLTPPLAGPELSFQATAAESPSLSQRQQQQQQFKGAEDLCAGCGLDTVALAGTAEGRVPQRHDQDVAPCTQLLPSALAARANGSLGTASGPGFVGRGLEEEDDYDGAIMADVPDKTSLLLSSTSWGIVQSATLQSAGLEPANVPNLKIQCNEPTEGSLPVPHQTHDHVEEVDNLMPMNGALDIQAAPAAVAPGSTPAVLMGSSCAELAPSTGSPGGCSNVVGAGPWGPGMESVDMDLSRHSSRTLNEVFSPMRSDAVVPSPLKGLASPLTKQATPELLPPTQSSLRGTPALRTLQTPSSLQLLHSQMHAPDRENNAVALSGGFGPDNLATELHTAAAADAYRFVAPTMPPNDGADVAKGSAGPGPHAMLADAQSFGWAVQGLPRSLWHPLSPQQQQHPPTLPYVMQAPPCGGAAQPISDPSDTAAPIWALTLAAAAAAAEDSARATGTGCTHTHMAEAQDTMMPKTAAACSTGADAGAILPGSSEALGAFADVGPPPQGSEAPNPNPQEQHSTLPAAPPLPGPDVPLAARVGAIYALYCLHATQICCPSVRIYVPLPLLRSMTGTVQEAAAAGLRDVVVIVRELWRQGALVPGGVACFNGSTSAPSSDKSHVWMAAAAGRAKAVAAGHGCAHKYLDASTRRLATFHDVLMSNPVLRQALLHLRTALPLLADMEGFERLCDLYGKQRTAVFQENGNGGDAGASCSSAPDVLFEARVGGDVRRMVRRMFAEVLRALRLPPPKIQRTEQKRRQRELEVQRKAEEAARLEAEMASGPRTVAEALAQVAAKPPAPLRRRVAGELGANWHRLGCWERILFGTLPCSASSHLGCCVRKRRGGIAFRL
ncbi:hypothetical protein Vretimale_12168 [Volvox reticuliferus]|uniref:Uncharacterized protein n=1 Tax=Volvox reticuliferus TaxID=1737510 RepID=A0A8J4GJQ5_9CHLO|nr:hypothetical protein Vretimale_12168 [Volvox reticuliferus]